MQHWKRNLWIIWFCQFLAIMGMSMVVPFLPFYVRELGVTGQAEITRWSGWIFAAPFFILPFSSPFWAMIGDRHGRKIMVVRAIFGLALSQIIIGMASSVEHVLVGRLIQGTFGGFIGAALALVSTRTPREHLGYALATLQTATACGALAGPFFGGLIADTVGYPMAFYTVGLLCVLSGIVVIWKVDEHPPSMHGDAPKIRFLERYRFLWHSRELRWCLLIALLSSAANTAVMPVLALFVESLLHTDAMVSTKTGLIVSIGALAIIATSKQWGRRSDRHLYRSNIVWCAGLAGVMFALQSFSQNVWQFIPLHILENAFFCGIFITLFSLISRRTEERVRGGVLSVISSFQTLGVLIGPLTGSYLAAHFRLSTAFLFSGATLMAVMLLGFRLKNELAVQCAPGGSTGRGGTDAGKMS